MKRTLTIGITAYNEEANLGALLSALIKQQITSAQLVEILVVSDASVDSTDTIVESFSKHNVKLIRLPERGGSCNAQNIIMNNVNSEILVVLDADILPENEVFIEKLIEPIITNTSVALTSSVLMPATPETFTEKVLARNHRWKVGMFQKIHSGVNLFTCTGPARALSRKFYKELKYPENVPYDAVSYMYCVTNKMQFTPIATPKAIFRCPSNLKDHIRQSSRFLAGKKAVIGIFGDRAIEAYEISRFLFIKSTIREFFSYPILFGSFLVFSLIVRVNQKNKFVSKWDMATSSKRI